MSPESKGSEVFSTEDVQMQYEETPNIISHYGNANQTTARNHFIPPRMAPQMARNSERLDSSKCLDGGGHGEIDPHTELVGM